jgi:hypothetical protein
MVAKRKKATENKAGNRAAEWLSSLDESIKRSDEKRKAFEESYRVNADILTRRVW